MKYESRILKVVVCPPGKSMFDEMCTFVELDTEGGGEFVKVSQNQGEIGDPVQEIKIDPDEWPLLRKEIDDMIKRCRDDS